MFRMTINEAGQVDYRALIDALNWRKNAAAAASAGCATRAPVSGSSWRGNEASSQLVQAVRADALMQDLTA